MINTKCGQKFRAQGALRFFINENPDTSSQLKYKRKLTKAGTNLVVISLQGISLYSEQWMGMDIPYSPVYNTHSDKTKRNYSIIIHTKIKKRTLQFSAISAVRM